MGGFNWNSATADVAARGVRRQIGAGGFMALAEQAKQKMEPFVPKNTGALVRSASVSAEDSKGMVTYSAAHAAVCYYGSGVSFGTEKHPLATSFWDVAAYR